MTLNEILLNGGGTLLIILALVEISPLKINPWKFILNGLGKMLNGDLLQQMQKCAASTRQVETQLSQIAEELRAHIQEAEQRDAINCRVRILSFGDEILHGHTHSKDSFDQVLQDITRYEQYCADHPDFTNHITVLTSTRIKEVYMDRLHKNDFL